MNKVLIYAVEDDDSIMELYKYALNNEHYDCIIFEKSEDLFDALETKLCDIIILDIMLPTIDGFKTLELLKSSKNSHIPVIIVSAKNNEMNKVKGLELGANDYLSKPFGILELVARIKVNLNKNATNNKSNLLEDGEIIVNLDKYSVSINDRTVNFTNKEYLLLIALMKSYGKVKTRDSLLDEVWGYDYYGETRTLDMHIKELRNKISQYAKDSYIHTVRSVGYIFERRISE